MRDVGARVALSLRSHNAPICRRGRLPCYLACPSRHWMPMRSGRGQSRGRAGLSPLLGGTRPLAAAAGCALRARGPSLRRKRPIPPGRPRRRQQAQSAQHGSERELKGSSLLGTIGQFPVTGGPEVPQAALYPWRPHAATPLALVNNRTALQANSPGGCQRSRSRGDASVRVEHLCHSQLHARRLTLPMLT